MRRQKMHNAKLEGMTEKNNQTTKHMNRRECIASLQLVNADR
jgi:hypothetical protein